MATYTANYAMIKPSYADVADVAAINQNTDTIDEIMHGSQTSIADAYDPAETYAAGDLAMHDFQLYKCNTDDTTGTWDPTKWERTTAAAEGGGGGGSAVSITPTLSTGTKIADFEVDGVPGELYAPNGGGGGGGGSSQTVADVLWSGSTTPNTAGTDITLNHAISDYDFIVFTVNQNSGYDSIVVVAVNELTIGESYIETGYGGSSMDVYFDYTSDTIINIKSSASAYLTTYTKITGLKFCGTLAPMIYSTEEREVGAWIDNKPLYQKTVSFLAPSGGGNHSIMDVSGLDIDSLVNIEGKGVYQDYLYSFPTRTAFFAIEQNYLKFNVSNDDWGGYTINVTLLFTKTADAPGSGSYGALGVPMEHYDGVERVVGTWQGETLYQKTFNVSDLSCTTSDYFGSYSGSLDLSGYIGNFSDVFLDLDMSYVITSQGVKERFVLMQLPPNSTSIYVFTCASRSNVSAVITIKYTKATT